MSLENQKTAKLKKYYDNSVVYLKWSLVALLILGLLWVVWITSYFVTDITIQIFLIISEVSVFVGISAFILRGYYGKKLDHEELTNLQDLEKEFNNSTSKIDYLSKRVDFSYQGFRERTSWTLGNVRFYKYSTIILTTLATIILGLNFDFLDSQSSGYYLKVSKDVALVLNATVAALTTLSIFWNVDKYWIQNKVIKQQLKMLKYEIEYVRATNDSDEIKRNVDQYFQKYIRILSDFYLYWEGVLTESRKDDK